MHRLRVRKDVSLEDPNMENFLKTYEKLCAFLRMHKRMGYLNIVNRLLKDNIILNEENEKLKRELENVKRRTEDEFVTT